MRFHCECAVPLPTDEPPALKEEILQMPTVGAPNTPEALEGRAADFANPAYSSCPWQACGARSPASPRWIPTSACSVCVLSVDHVGDAQREEDRERRKEDFSEEPQDLSSRPVAGTALHATLLTQKRTFRARIEKPARTKVGIILEGFGHALKVKDIKPNGFVAEWNRQHSTTALQVGDFIVGVNEVRGQGHVVMLEEFITSTVVELEIVRWL